MPNDTSFCKDYGYQVPTSASDDDGKILPEIAIAAEIQKAPRSESLAGSRRVDNRSRTHLALEGGWAWAVVLSGFTLHVLTRGCLFSTGVLFSEWTSYFGKSKRDTALIGSITTGCALMLGPLASRLVEKWGYRVMAMAGGAISTIGFFASYWANGVYYLYLTYGLIAGTGMGVSYLCGVVAVGEYFDERRSIAFGIAAAGAGCGASVMAVLQRLLLEEYGWRGTMIVIAGLSGLNQIAFGALLRPLSSSLNWKSKAGRKRLLNNQFDRSLGGDTTPTEVSGSSAREKAILMGISESNAAYLVAVIGIGNVIGKVGIGLLCDMKWTDIFVVFVTSQIGLAVSVMMYPLFTSYGTLVFTSFLFGFFYGNYSAIPSLTAEYVGLHNLAQAIGYINFLEGLAGIIGPPLAGAIYDASLSYNAAFAVAAGFLVISSLVLGLQPYFYKRMTGERSTLEKMFTCSKCEVKASRMNGFLQGNDIATNIEAKDHNANCIKVHDRAEETGQINERNFHA